jgi:hypothetical protein
MVDLRQATYDVRVTDTVLLRDQDTHTVVTSEAPTPAAPGPRRWFTVVLLPRVLRRRWH